jgi:hypothetical protein
MEVQAGQRRMRMERLTTDYPVLIANGMMSQVPIHQAPVVGEGPEQGSRLWASSVRP